MEYTKLGNTEIIVSRLCFGGLIIGPLQANLSINEGANVILKALELGINFIDTAEIYGTYPHIRQAIKKFKGNCVISTKSYAVTSDDAKRSLERARKEMDLDVIDIFLLHEQESEHTLRGHRGAIEYFTEAKEKGLIKAFGISTHNIQGVLACVDNSDIDVIHPIVNKAGLGIADGSIDEMIVAVKMAYENGKGIYSMKPLGGGNLIGSYGESIKFVLDLPFVHSIAIGMQSEEEVIVNTSVFDGIEPTHGILEKLNSRERTLHIDYWCESCGKCVSRCKQGTLRMVDDKVVINSYKCVLCGYCASVCPVFAIKIF